MGLKELAAAGVALAASLTTDFQATVTHKAATGARSEDGTMRVGGAVSRKAIVTNAEEIIATPGGNSIVARTKVTFLGAVTVTTEDQIKLPNGRTPAIRKVEPGVLDSTGTGFVTVVYCD